MEHFEIVTYDEIKYFIYVSKHTIDSKILYVEKLIKDNDIVSS